MKNKTLRNGGIILLVIGVLIGIFLIIQAISANYQLNKNYMSYWSLSDKSSTLQAKDSYISLFVNSIESNRHDFADYDAIFLKTPDNSFDYNLQALKTLQTRLENISTMDENSFAYQTAIQQITAQEQGEADNLIGRIKGCGYLKNYPYLWDWISVIFTFLTLGVIVFGVILIAYYYDNKDTSSEDGDILT